MTHLKIGDDAPEINSIDENGEKITLSQFKGKKVILYFYIHGLILYRKYCQY